jgi:hypothetical protein
MAELTLKVHMTDASGVVRKMSFFMMASFSQATELTFAIPAVTSQSDQARPEQEPGSWLGNCGWRRNTGKGCTHAEGPEHERHRGCSREEFLHDGLLIQGTGLSHAMDEVAMTFLYGFQFNFFHWQT